MPYISLPEGLPGIRGPMAFRPETAKPLNELADILLRGPHTLSPGERELIATFVSSQTDCRYCQTIHGAIAAHHLGGNEDLVIQVKADPRQAAISDKLKALLVIAGKAAEGGKRVTTEDVARARQHGATDLEIHDTVLRCLYVQSLCERPRDLGTRRSGFLPRARRPHSRARVHLGDTAGKGSRSYLAPETSAMKPATWRWISSGGRS